LPEELGESGLLEATMKKVAWILASGALIMACGGGPSRTDTGPVGNDSGPIVLMDSGPATGRDTGPPRNDTGGGSAMMCGTWQLSATSVGAIPPSCLPRCSNATLGAVNTCLMGMDTSCLGPALQGDTTPTISMTFEAPGGSDALDLDCAGCYQFQLAHCFSDPCPSQTTPWLVCNPAMDADMCMGEQTALQTCLDGIAMGSAEETALNNCGNAQIGACFDTGGGFLPSSQQLSTAALRNLVRVGPALAR